MRCVALHSHISAIRTRYDSNGGQLRLCAESKKLLNLLEPSRWRLDNLITVQPLVITPLLKYWSEHSLNIPLEQYNVVNVTSKYYIISLFFIFSLLPYW